MSSCVDAAFKNTALLSTMITLISNKAGKEVQTEKQLFIKERVFPDHAKSAGASSRHRNPWDVLHCRCGQWRSNILRWVHGLIIICDTNFYHHYVIIGHDKSSRASTSLTEAKFISVVMLWNKQIYCPSEGERVLGPMQISNVAINIFGHCEIKPEIKCIPCISQKEYEIILIKPFLELI